MDIKERSEAIEELTNRLPFFTDERLKLLLKSSTPRTDEDYAEDVKRLSKNLR